MLTTGEVAQRLGVSTRTVERLVATGQIPVIRMGARCNRFKPAEIERFINKNATKRRTMTKTILIAALLLFNVAANAVEINGKLIHAVGFVESNNNPNAVGDNQAANGSFQMHRPSWADCSAWLKSQGFKVTPYQQGVNDPTVSHYYCKIYLSLLHRQLARALDREISAGDLYAAYNLGFTGYKRRGFDLSKCPTITQRAVAKLNRKLGE